MFLTRFGELNVGRALSSALIFLFVAGGIAFARRPQHPEQTHAAKQAPQTPAQPAAVGIDPANLDFGDQVVKRIIQPERLTITNTGGKPLYVNSASITNEDEWKDFAIVRDTCTGATVAPNKSCVIDVRFTPSETGDRNATLVLKDNAVDSPQSVSLTGNGINSVDVPPFQDR